MNNIANYLPLTGATNRQSSPYDFRSAGYVQEQSLKSRESLDTDLVIHTKDGDKISISSDSFSQLDAQTYNSQGVVQTQSGTAAFSHNYREISLASGKSFSYSVEGSLDENELKDLDAMLKGLDGIVSDVKGGDMQGALDGALGLGTFDTFSAYKVDISYEQYYEMSSSMASMVTESQQVGSGQVSDNLVESGKEPQKQGVPFNPDKFFEKLLKQFENHEEKFLAAAKDPVHKLFQHHMGELKDDVAPPENLLAMLQSASDRLESFLEKFTPEEQADVESPDEKEDDD